MSEANRFRFRAWMPNQGYMDTTLGGASVGWLHPDAHGDAIVMQSTGLCDSAGTEIFEGDVVRYDGRNRVVAWNESGSAWMQCTEIGRTFIDSCGAGDLWLSKSIAPNVYEVIGNIHENPELLNTDKESTAQ